MRASSIGIRHPLTRVLVGRGTSKTSILARIDDVSSNVDGEWTKKRDTHCGERGSERKDKASMMQLDLRGIHKDACGPTWKLGLISFQKKESAVETFKPGLAGG